MYRNTNLTSVERASDLLSKMTLDEKIMQMSLHPTLIDTYNELNEKKELKPMGSTFRSPSSPEIINKIQEYMVNETKSGIPLLLACEGIRGVVNQKATVFPHCSGLGGSFNKELINQMADVIGKEAYALGVRQIYGPDLDVPRDPRWGRMQECYGEDPYLVGEMGEAYVKGLQKNNVAATLKHFIGYCEPEGGLNLAPNHLGEREVREVMLEPYIKCIKAGAMSLMPAYNEIDGIPLHSSERYMNEILRDELGFDGMVISDYGALEFLHSFHNIAKDAKEAAKLGLNCGVHLEGQVPFAYSESLKQAVLNNEIDEKLIDDAVYHILKLKFDVGLFENPYSSEEALKEVHNKNAVDLSLKLDEQSILLLENDGILPLDETKIGKVAVIGNNAKDSFTGDYIVPTPNCVSFYDGMVSRLGEDKVLYAKGCKTITHKDEEIREAVETAKKADIVFLVLGDSTAMGAGNYGGSVVASDECTSGEGFDTHSLDFTRSQQTLFDAVIALGKPTILVVYAGRPYTIMDEVSKTNAFMFSWGAGEQSGNAFANLIFGDKSPSAKLSVSFPQTVGHLPCYYNYKVSARGNLYKKPGSYENPGRDYVLSSPDAWYPFGYGLSYTTLEYSDLKAQVLDNGNVSVSVSVENKGDYDIDESVLLFVRTLYCPITPFIKKLRKFEKVNIKKGDKKVVNFTLTDEDFSYIDKDYKTAKATGKQIIMIDKLEYEIEI